MSASFPIRIGDYSPRRLLGQGANSSVFLCLNSEGEEVALKWMNHPTRALVQRFKREISTLERVENPYIIRHRDHGEWQGRPYLVMDLVRGHDLRVYASKLGSRPSMERYRRVREIGRDLCLALQHLHGLGLVHRDIKPSNVMRTEEGRVVLTDFGIVKDLDGLERTDVGMVIGTMAFAAPEQMEGERVDSRADLFGLGATLYYLLTLRRPYEQVPRSPAQRPLPPSIHDPEIPPDLEAVVLRLMAHQPQHRYPDAHAAAYALGQGRAEGVPVAGRQEALLLVAQALRAAERGEAICLRPSGPLGAGKGWLADVVRQGARSRGVQVFEVREIEASRDARVALASEGGCVVVDSVGMDLEAGAKVIEVPLVPLGLADVRRTVVGVAPRTREPAIVSDRIHRLTGGIPGLLVPLITRYSVEGAIDLPEEVGTPALVDAFFEGLGVDELEILAVIVLCWPPPSTELIEEVTQVPSVEILEMMKARGLVTENRGEWRLGASLFRSRVLEGIADPEGIEARIRSYRRGAGVAFAGEKGDIMALLALGRDRVMAGAFFQGIGDLQRACDLARGLEARGLEAEALRTMGLAWMETGRRKRAAVILADATALARAAGLDGERRLCHVLRAQITLERARHGSASALGALDRLMPIDSGSSLRKGDSGDALMHALWSRLSSSLGDFKTAVHRAERAVEALRGIPQIWQARVWLHLGRSALCRVSSEAAHVCLEHARECTGELPLLHWWAEAGIASLNGETLPLSMRMGPSLTGDERQELERLASF